MRPQMEVKIFSFKYLINHSGYMILKRIQNQYLMDERENETDDFNENEIEKKNLPAKMI